MSDRHHNNPTFSSTPPRRRPSREAKTPSFNGSPKPRTWCFGLLGAPKPVTATIPSKKPLNSEEDCSTNKSSSSTKAAKIYSRLKQPISQGLKLAKYVNSLFVKEHTSARRKKSNKNPPSSEYFPFDRKVNKFRGVPAPARKYKSAEEMSPEPSCSKHTTLPPHGAVKRTVKLANEDHRRPTPLPFIYPKFSSTMLDQIRLSIDRESFLAEVSDDRKTSTLRRALIVDKWMDKSREKFPFQAPIERRRPSPPPPVAPADDDDDDDTDSFFSTTSDISSDSESFFSTTSDSFFGGEIEEKDDWRCSSSLSFESWIIGNAERTRPN